MITTVNVYEKKSLCLILALFCTEHQTHQPGRLKNTFANFSENKRENGDNISANTNKCCSNSER